MRTPPHVLPALFVAALTGSASAQKAQATTLSSGGISLGASVDASNETVHTAWNLDERILVRTSWDAGRSWSAETDLGTGFYADVPDVRTDGNHVCVTWHYNGIYANRSLDHGRTWMSHEVRVDTGPLSVSAEPDLALAGSTAIVAYESSRTPMRGVFVNRSLDGGMTWAVADVRLDDGAAPCNYPKVAITGQNAYVAWIDQNRGAMFAYSRDLGGTWSPPTTLGTPGLILIPSGIRIACDDTQVHVAFSTSRRAGIVSSTDSGATWTTPKILENLARPDTTVAVENGLAIVAYSITSAPGVYAHRSTDGGQTWSSRAKLDYGQVTAATPGFPRIAITGPTVGIAWIDPRDGFRDTYFTRSLDGGLTWPNYDVRLQSNAPGTARTYTAEIADSAGAFYAIWVERVPTGPAVFFNLPFGTQPYGLGTPGSGGHIPKLTDFGRATLGSAVGIRVEKGLGGTIGAWMIGATATATRFAGGDILATPSFAFPFALSGNPGEAGAGEGTISIPVPGNLMFLGAALYVQAILLDPNGTGGVTLSDAREVWIG